jgi:hypothetical protein
MVVICRAGGIVAYDWEWGDHDFVAGAKPPAPPWLVNLVGEDYFGHVAAVSLYDASGRSRPSAANPAQPP